MTNFNLCAHTFNFLKQCEVDTVIICAGARNAPFVFHLESQNFKQIYFFEERSAAFFALGLMKQKNKPVAVITTSGTAAAELLPATIEAFYQGLPLILITADRPKTYRHSGAPQAIQQVGLFSHYVEHSFDWDVTETNFKVVTSLQKPIHFNICFDEPLMDAAVESKQTLQLEKLSQTSYQQASAQDFKNLANPLVIVGQIADEKRKDVVDFLLALKAPIYLEALSQLKGEEKLYPYLVNCSDAYIKKIFQNQWCDSVTRIGGVPTLRFWRDLEDKFKTTMVYNFTDVLFSGLARTSTNFKIDFKNFTASAVENKNLSAIKNKDQELEATKLNLINEFSNSEPACIRHLSSVVNSDPIYLGNSLPIREWDLFADIRLSKKQIVYANRGANGIDGQVSTYLGWSDCAPISWCLVGDLTAMYDLAALGLTAQLQSKNKRRLVIMNNQGGHIFKRVFNKDQFLNSHQIEFEMWAKMWKWDYLKVKTIEDFQKLKSNASVNLVVEIQPDSQQTTLFWNQWDQACNKI